MDVQTTTTRMNVEITPAFNCVVETPVYEYEPPYDETEVYATASREIIIAAFREGGIIKTEAEGNALLDLILEYRKDKEIPVYNRLPNIIRRRVTDIHSNMVQRLGGFHRGQYRHIPSTEVIAKQVLDELMSERAFDIALAQIEKDQNDEMSSMVDEFTKEVDDGYEEMFAQIEQLREENPEAAERIEKCKVAYDEANSIRTDNWGTLLISYVDFDKRRNILRYLRDYASEVIMTNNALKAFVADNIPGVKMPDLDKFFGIIERSIDKLNFTPAEAEEPPKAKAMEDGTVVHDESPEEHHYGISSDAIKRYIVVLCRVIKQRISKVDKSDNTAYIAEAIFIYKLLSNIYRSYFNNKLFLNPDEVHVFKNVHKDALYIDRCVKHAEYETSEGQKERKNKKKRGG